MVLYAINIAVHFIPTRFVSIWFEKRFGHYVVPFDMFFPHIFLLSFVRILLISIQFLDDSVYSSALFCFVINFGKESGLHYKLFASV